jgi:hypothetical protein
VAARNRRQRTLCSLAAVGWGEGTDVRMYVWMRLQQMDGGRGVVSWASLCVLKPGPTLIC